MKNDILVEVVHKPDYSYEADMVRRLKELLSAKVVQISSDLISRADAIKVACDTCSLPSSTCEWKDNGNCDTKVRLEALPSADVVSREEYDALYKKWVEAEQMIDYYDTDGDDEMVIEASSAEATLQLNRIDTLIIANALRYLINDEERHESDRAAAESLRKQILKYGASMCKGDK